MAPTFISIMKSRLTAFKLQLVRLSCQNQVDAGEPPPWGFRLLCPDTSWCQTRPFYGLFLAPQKTPAKTSHSRPGVQSGRRAECDLWLSMETTIKANSHTIARVGFTTRVIYDLIMIMMAVSCVWAGRLSIMLCLACDTRLPPVA